MSFVPGMPACSVLLPVHNAERTLTRCIDSIAGQSLENFELVAVDDGSTDATAEILANAARTDSRVRVISPGRVGLVEALNLGLARCHSEYVARMDADDWMHPLRLEQQLAFLVARQSVSVAGCAVKAEPENKVAAGYREYVRWQNDLLGPRAIADDIYVESPLAHPSVMFRKARIEASGGYRAGDFPEDYELWLRLHASGHDFGKCPQVLLHWFESPGRTSRSDERYRREAFDALRARYLARDPRVRQASELVVWGAGRKTRKRVRRLLDHGIELAGWVDIDPAKIGQRLWGRPVHPPDSLCGPRPGRLVLVYVTNHGAREQIAAYLDDAGHVRGRDYLCVG